MKLVISPAKSLDFETELPTPQYTEACFLKEAAQLNKTLQKKSPKQLAKLMDISANLAELNWKRNQEFSLPFSPENARPAAYAFNGDVYQGLDVYTLPQEKLEQLQQTVRILSGLYGVLKPLDLIQPYRLEMGTKLPIGKSKDLYGFWRKKVTQKLNEELENGELFLNLASNEYFGAVDAKALKVPVITPQFKDYKNGQLKMISFFAKKARGLMVRYIIDTNAQTIDDLKNFNYEGYRFSEEHSKKKNELVFVR